MQDDEADGRAGEGTEARSSSEGGAAAEPASTVDDREGRAGAGRNILLALLAFQNGFIEHRVLIDAIHAWVGDKRRPMGAILLGRGALDAGQVAALGPLVEQHLKAQGGDADRGFALPGATASLRAELGVVPDSDVQTVLVHLETTRIEETKDRDPSPPAGEGPPDRSGCRYRIVKHHARGGLGDVYVAFDGELRRKVALKEIQARHASSPQNRARFLLEAEVTGSLEHPGIVPVHGLGTYPDGRPFYAMRLIKGESLKQAIAKFRAKADPASKPGDRALGLRRLLGRFLDVCDAVEYAHSRGVLHRDLKPSNIMLGKFGETLVVDWGLAKIVGRTEEAEPSTLDGEDEAIRPSSSSDVEPTRMQAVYGTPQYMSPEQATGRIDRIGVASDVYGLGATLYCLLTGRPPFPDEGFAKIKAALLRGDFPRPRAVDASVAPALEAICLKAMAPEPEGRYRSAGALGEDLERWLADEPVSAYRDPPPARLARWARRHKAPVAGGLALLAASAVGLAIFGFLVGIERDKAERGRDLAVEATRRSDETLTFARKAIDSLLVRVTTEGLASTPRMQEFRGYLADEAVRVAADLVRTRPDEVNALITAAPIYHRAAFIHRLLSRYPQAFDEFRRAIGYYERLVVASPGTRSHRDNLAMVALDYAEGLRMSGDDVRALELYDRARREAERMRAEFPGDPIYEQTLARAHYNKAEILIEAGRHREAGEAEEVAIALLDRRLARNKADDTDRFLRTYPLRGRGIVARELDRPGEAAAAFDLALKGLDDLKPRDERSNSVAYLRASILDEQGLLMARDPGRLDEAERAYDRAVEILARLVEQFDGITFYRHDLAVALIHRAGLRARRGEARKADAVADAARAAKILEGLLAIPSQSSATHGRLGEALGLLGRLEGDPAEARRLLDRAVVEQEAALAVKPERPSDRLAREAHRKALAELPAPPR